jgi:hypothetical protein
MDSEIFLRLDTANGRRNPTPDGTRHVIEDVECQIESVHEEDDIVAIVPYTFEKSLPLNSNSTLPLVGKFEVTFEILNILAVLTLERNLA